MARMSTCCQGIIAKFFDFESRDIRRLFEKDILGMAT
jgi:hypothetical protein